MVSILAMVFFIHKSFIEYSFSDPCIYCSVPMSCIVSLRSRVKVIKHPGGAEEDRGEQECGLGVHVSGQVCSHPEVKLLQLFRAVQ